MTRDAPTTRSGQIIERVRQRSAERDERVRKEKGGLKISLDSMKVPDSLALVVLLFPGLLTERVAAYFSDSPKTDSVQLVTGALAATLIVVALAIAIGALLRTGWPALDFREYSLPQLAQNAAFLTIVTIVSVLSGLMWAYLDGNDKIFSVSPTARVSRQSVLALGLKHADARGYHARVETVGGSTYHGLVQYRNPSADGGLYLTSALLEVQAERSSDRVRSLISQCTKRPCRIPVACVEVGDESHGTVFLPMNAVRLIEFRPTIDTTTHPKKGGTVNVYSCDVFAHLRYPAASSPGQGANKSTP